MKKILASITIVVMLSITSSAMATVKAKMPKQLCLQFSALGTTQQLSFKGIGTIFNNGSKIKTYTAIGSLDDVSQGGPIFGSAYIKPGTTILHASYNANYGAPFNQYIAFFELLFDLATQTGTVEYNITGDATASNSVAVFSTDCQMLAVPYDAPADSQSMTPSITQ